MQYPIIDRVKDVSHRCWMIKHIADRQGAHMQKSNSVWIKATNQGKDVGYSAISVFATQMMYAATKQIKELSNYYVTELIMETLL